MRAVWLDASLFLMLSLAAVRPAAAQTEQPSQTLVVSGQPGHVAIMQFNGRSVIDLEALARLVNGSVSFKGNQTILTLPGSGPSAAAATVPQASQPSNSGFSKQCMTAGIEFMSAIREWRSALANNLQNGYPVSASWVTRYSNKAAESLRLASVAASTDSDQQALPLLQNEFDFMQKWSNKVLDAVKNMDTAKYMSDDALNNDALFQKTLTCARSLAAMAASRTFQDDGSCD
jgi:hypothetical protein